MKTHHATLTTLVLAMVWATVAGAAEPVTVVVEGGDAPLTGYLRNISESRFLLQADDAYYEFTAGQIVSVDGRDEVPGSAWGESPLVQSSHYEVVRADGDAEMHTQIEFTNRSDRFLTSTEWGVGAHEEAMYATAVAHDNWGNRLDLHLLDEGDRRRAILHFAVPVAPGETSTFALRFLLEDAAVREDDSWSYTFNVDFPEDRYFFRKVALPPGAEVLETYGGSRKLEVQGRSLLVSQRYYPAGTVDPLTVRYRLP